MARVDFYVLSQAGPQSRQAFACRLAEKAWRLENSVHIHAADRTTAEQMDQLLWTFRDGSFVPHDLAEDAGKSTPISIGYGDQAEPRDLLINLCDEIPRFAETFPRIAELVTSDDEARQLSRKRFADYRNQGHTLETHNV